MRQLKRQLEEVRGGKVGDCSTAPHPCGALWPARNQPFPDSCQFLPSGNFAGHRNQCMGTFEQGTLVNLAFCPGGAVSGGASKALVQ